MKMYIYLLVLGCFLLKSCVRDVDFDQLDDIEINTIHNFSLIHFDMEPSNFLDDFENEVLMSSDTIALPIFGGNYTVNYLNQAELKYKFSNSFDRNGSLEIEFLDAYNGSLFTLQKIYIDATARVADSAVIGEGSQIWINVQVRENAVIGRNCIISKDVSNKTESILLNLGKRRTTRYRTIR